MAPYVKYFELKKPLIWSFEGINALIFILT